MPDTELEELIPEGQIRKEIVRADLRIETFKSVDGASYFTAFVSDKKGHDFVLKVLSHISTDTREKFFVQLRISKYKENHQYGDYLMPLEQFELGDFLAIKMPYGDMSATELSGAKDRTIQDVLKCVIDLAKGTCAIHEFGSIHRDIHPGNGIHIKDHFVLSDYSRTSSSRLTSSAVGIEAYWAPEVLVGDDKSEQYFFSFETDIWALGAVFNQLMLKQVNLLWRDWTPRKQQVLKQDPERFLEMLKNASYIDGVTEEMVEYSFAMMHPSNKERIFPIQHVIAGLERLYRGESVLELSPSKRFDASYRTIENLINNATRDGPWGTTPIDTICSIMDEYENVLLKIKEQVSSKTMSKRVASLEARIQALREADARALWRSHRQDRQQILKIPDREERIVEYARRCLEKDRIGCAWGPPLESSRYSKHNIDSNGPSEIMEWVEIIEEPSNWRAIREKYASK